jgi:2-polyprenyl-6-methoxyphenol hydroxylase-like FAD-dependent oxidoreductase
LVEVHWAPRSEAYVTPVSDDVVGIGLLFARPHRNGPRREGPPGDGMAGRGAGDDAGGDFEARLSAFPALLARLGEAAPASEVRGAGPMRQDVRRRVYGRVLLVGDASGYVDALTGEGIGVGLAQAEALARCLVAGRPADYERAWRRASGPAWRFTAGLLWSRNHPFLGPRIVPAAQRLPWLFAALVNHAAQA